MPHTWIRFVALGLALLGLLAVFLGSTAIAWYAYTVTPHFEQESMSFLYAFANPVNLWQAGGGVVTVGVGLLLAGSLLQLCYTLVNTLTQLAHSLEKTA